MTVRRLLWAAGIWLSVLFTCSVFGSWGSYVCARLSGGETDGLGGPVIVPMETTAEICTQPALPAWIGVPLWIATLATIAVVAWRGMPRTTVAPLERELTSA
jgi:hypothetical protein